MGSHPPLIRLASRLRRRNMAAVVPSLQYPRAVQVQDHCVDEPTHICALNRLYVTYPESGPRVGGFPYEDNCLASPLLLAHQRAN